MCPPPPPLTDATLTGVSWLYPAKTWALLKRDDCYTVTLLVLLLCACRILQSESEALACEDSVVLDLPQLLDMLLGQAVALRCDS